MNGPLQGRMLTLDLDNSRANQLPADYDTDLESIWSNPSTNTCLSFTRTMMFLDLFADGDDFSSETIEKNRNLFFQQQLATDISTEMNQASSLLTSMLNLHLNVGQNFTVNTSQVIMSLQTFSLDSLTSNESVTNNGITLPSSALINMTRQQSTVILVQVSLFFFFHYSPSSVSFRVS